MSLRRLIATAATLLLVGTLAACFPALPGLGTGGTGGTGTDGGTTGSTSSDLAGTTWGGTDSDGDDWVFELQSDGTVAVTFNGSRYDDVTDTWTLSGTTLDIHTVFVDSDYDFTGSYDGGSSIPLTGTWAGGSFTLTITQG